MKSQIERSAARWEKALLAVDAAENNLRMRDDELGRHLVLVYPSVGRFNFSVSPYHQCKDSPVGRCVYDGVMDPSHDCCLACGQPEERK